MTNQQILTAILLLAPILLIQLGLVIYAFIDLSHRKTLRGPRWAWIVGLIISAFAVPSGIIVCAIYLAWGRHTDMEDNDDSD
jgi:uncharacterized membrane protein